MYRHAPGTIWRRAIRRVDRRAADLACAMEAVREGHLNDADYFTTLLLEAVRQSNRIYRSCIERPNERTAA